MSRLFGILAVSMAAFWTLGFLAAEDGGPEHLYLVSGTPGQGLPVRIYALDSGRPGPLTMVDQVTEGLNSVLVDYEDRTVVIASPAIKPAAFSFINMNQPGRVTSREFKYVSDLLVPGGIYLLNPPGEGLGVALALGEVTPQNSVSYPSALTFVGLNPMPPPGLVPFEMLKYLRFAGEAGVVFPQLELTLRVTGDPLSALVGTTKTGLGIAGPPYLRERTNNLQVVVANDDAFMVTEPAGLAEPVIDVLNKSSNTWRRIPLPFAHFRLRTFGPWLAALELRSTPPLAHTGSAIIVRNRAQLATVEASPGAAKRASEQLGPGYRSAPGMTVDDLFTVSHVSGTVFPGELLIYNLKTDVQIRISTGSGDSEVVFANDDAVFYRVDDALFRCDIHGTTLGPPIKLAEGIEIVQVHWAFLN